MCHSLGLGVRGISITLQKAQNQQRQKKTASAHGFSRAPSRVSPMYRGDMERCNEQHESSTVLLSINRMLYLDSVRV